jgi:hypothetical protein
MPRCMTGVGSLLGCPAGRASSVGPGCSVGRARGRDLKAFDPLREEVDRFPCDARSILVGARLAKLLGCYPELLAACCEAR